MIKITIVGCCGRMGMRIASLASEDNEIKIAGAVEIKGSPNIGKNLGDIIGLPKIDVKINDDLKRAVGDSDVIIDFTKPTVTLTSLSVARELKIPIVIGTTGITDEELRVIKSASSSIPVLYSSNMSVGVNLLFKIVPEMAKALGQDYDIEIVEAHHNKKKDAPSGTAMTLAEQIAQARDLRLKDSVLYGREGNVGQRPKDQIGVHAVRGGGIVGDHTVYFVGANERIEITHRAHSRDIFAQGALVAAKYIADKSPGLYNMQNAIEGV
ncbi:4-hydroxy-tetrahydrodipicolinate reductase [Candidatus Omnitrophota bacterium]